MLNDQNKTDDWTPCQPGELTRMVKRLDAAERRTRYRQLARTGLLSMLVFAIGTMLVGGLGVFREPNYGGIRCSECIAHAEEYYQHLLGETLMADLTLAEQMKTHLELCDRCRPKFYKMYPDVAMGGEDEYRFQPPRIVFAVAYSPRPY